MDMVTITRGQYDQDIAEAKAAALRELADEMDSSDWTHKDDWGVSVIYPDALRGRADRATTFAEEAPRRMTIEVGILFDRGLWDRYCEVSGTSVWAVNEGQMDKGDSVSLTYGQAVEIGLMA